MDNPLMCLTHQQPALFYDHQLKPEGKQFVCKECIQQRFKIDPIEEYQESQNKTLQIVVTRSDQSLNLIKDLLECLEAYKQNLIKVIDNLYCSLNQKSKTLLDKQLNYSLLFKQYQDTTEDIMIQEEKSIMDFIKEFNDQIQIQLNTLVQASKTDNMFEILKKYSSKINLNNEEKEQKQQETLIRSFNECSTQSSIIIDKKIDYQLMQQQSYKQDDWCFAIAFNKDATIMVAGCGELIKVFEFQNDTLKELYQLSGHSQRVYCLKFMKKSNEFVSGSQDSTIIVWKQNQNKLWENIQVMKDHTKQIYSITINKNEDLLISGSYDKTIKFWSNQNNTWSCNQSIDCQSEIQSISLNDQEDKLIVSVKNNQIFLIQQQGKEWMIRQMIKVEQNGYRSRFINQNQFVFQPLNKQQLQIFDYDAKDQTYKIGQVIQYQNKEISSDDVLFPIQYISQIGLIIVKSNHRVHLIKRNQHGQYTVQQSINFNTPHIFGCITDDGRYIVTWDYKSKEIQIMKFEF